MAYSDIRVGFPFALGFGLGFAGMDGGQGGVWSLGEWLGVVVLR